MPDSPKAARRREHEKKAISLMVAMYCDSTHPDADKSFRGYCGRPLCKECLTFDEYAVACKQNCRSMEHKISCAECGNGCFAGSHHHQIQDVMRVAGPKLILKHPAAAFFHLIGI